MSLRRAALAGLLVSASASWLAVSPPASGVVDVFTLSDAGAKAADVVSFPIGRGETVDAGAFACGRCFCLLLGTNTAARASTIYNISFCLVPSPALESTLRLPGFAYNLHSAAGEGDGGSGYTVFIDTRATPATYHVAHVDGRAVTPLVDISAFVDADAGGVYPGGTAFCAETRTMWVAVKTASPAFDTLLTIDVGARAVTGNVSTPKPALTAHFADCKANAVGGVTQTPPDATGAASVVFGMVDAATGRFSPLDAVPLPRGSALALTGAADFLDDMRWAASEYGAVLLTDGRLPGAIVTSSAGRNGPGKLGALAVDVAGVAVAY